MYNPAVHPDLNIRFFKVERERAARLQETKKREEKDVRFRCFHALWGSNVWQNPWCVYDEKHSEYAIWPDDITANKVTRPYPPSVSFPPNLPYYFPFEKKIAHYFDLL